MSCARKGQAVSDHYTIIQGDCRSVMQSMPDCSVDAIITDPPYELGFMGKSWDSTGIAYDPQVWKEALRILKPGGHLLSFGGSRTYHRMACAIEDAGFEVRDQMMWVYGSGFPKSHNISKALDKAAGAEKEVIGQKKPCGMFSPDVPNFGSASDVVETYKHSPITAPATAAKQWEGWGTALKPAHEPIVLARKPIEGTVAENVLKWGVGGLNIDGCRVGTVERYNAPAGNKAGGNSLNMSSVGMPQNVEGTTAVGRFPANLMHDGSQQVLDLFPANAGAAAPFKSGYSGESNGIYNDYAKRGDDGATFYGEKGSAARFFYCPKASKSDRDEGCEDFQQRRESDRTSDNKNGGDNPRNRSNNPRKNYHPTVKPMKLMRYLCRLITPKGGKVLDPFNGSGSTGKAAILEGMTYVGIELSPEYIQITKGRLDHALEQLKHND